MIGERLGSYRVLRQVGQGGMGVVYEAVHEQIQRRAAVKVLHAHRTGDPEATRRLFNEALAANVVDHPGLVGVFESGTLPDGRAYLIMEYLDGESLCARLQRLGRLPLGPALRIAERLAVVLKATHDKGIVHRDLKSANVMLVPDPEAQGQERVKLLDFGIAKLAEAHRSGEVRTSEGVAMGTSAYMPPEQWLSAHVADARADVYSLGVLLYEMLTGRCPFTAQSASEWASRHLHQPPPSLADGGVAAPPELELLVGRMLAKTRASRPSMREVADALTAMLALEGAEAAARGADADTTVDRAPAMELGAGERVGKYRVVRLLGRGGMGTVYEAVHEEIGRRAAIKVLHPERAADPSAARRFLDEARAVTSVRHPGLVEVYDFDRLADGRAYIVMELLAGEPLSARLRRGPLREAEALQIGRQVALAIQAAHVQGVVHRDLTPQNIMLVPGSEGAEGWHAKVIDFGIAKVPGEGGVTRGGALLGTAPYMSPEQCRDAGQVGPPADVYALGVILFEMIAGAPPFAAMEEVEVMALHLRAEPPSLKARSPQAPGELAALVGRMLAKGEEERPAMSEVAAELQRVMGLPPAALRSVGGARPAGPRRSRAMVLLGGGIALVGLLVSGGLWRARQQGLAPRPGRPARILLAAPAPPVPPTVEWLLRSHPAGAEVVRADTGSVLGTTPLRLRWPQGPGTVPLRLRKKGYLPRDLQLESGQDATRDEVLVWLPE